MDQQGGLRAAWAFLLFARKLTRPSALQLIGQPDTTFVREVSFVVPSSLANPNLPPDVASSIADLEPPKLLMASTNLTLANVMQCRESISYLPHPWPHMPKPTASQFAPSLEDAATTFEPDQAPSEPHPLSHPLLPDTTLFSQSALIFSTGLFASQPYPPVGISRASPIKPVSLPRANTMPQRALGNKVEQWAAARFETNAETGRSAMDLAAKRLWEAEWAQVKAQMSG